MAYPYALPFMIVIPREICRDISSAMTREWVVRNGSGGYAAATITGALTRRYHGLLVAAVNGEHHVMLAKLDEELDVDGRVYKLGTNEYLTNVINPDGFLYLQQVTYDGVTAEFVYEAGRFQLTKTIWMADGRNTTYIRYALAEHSAPARLTLVPLCDYRNTDTITQGSEQWHFYVERLTNGIRVQPTPDATSYRLLADPRAVYTPLDLWYWRFQLRAENSAGMDLYVPGLFRMDLTPGSAVTLIATCESDENLDTEIEHALASARARQVNAPVPASDEFSPAAFGSPQ